MEATIEVAGLRKRFGSAQALDGMSFSVLPGQVTGFVGPNGAAIEPQRPQSPALAGAFPGPGRPAGR